MKKALVIGSRSDIAIAAIERLKQDYEIIPVDRKTVDLNYSDATARIRNLLALHQPDVIVQSAGVFQFNDTDFDLTFNVNLKSHWAVIKYYLDNPPAKPVKFVMVGSSTYKQGRKNFVLYAASRAALYSMWQGSSECCSENVKLGLINAVRVNTKHVAHIPHPHPELCLEADDVAQVIVDLCNNMTESRSIDMDYKTNPTV